MAFQNDTNQTLPVVPPELQNPKPKENTFKEVVKFTVLALIIVIPIKFFVAQPFIVSGASMDPTFKSGDYLIVDQISYRLHEPQREDVVIFRYPLDPKTFYIKRIIGLPGETLKVVDGKITVINKDHPEGMVIDDPHVAADHRTSDNYSVTLKDDQYFVMGDNRPESSDSRIWGPLDRKFIVGRPILRLLPFSAISTLPGN